MTYAVFILIAAAAASYLFLADTRSRTRPPAADSGERQRLGERIEAIRLSLQDLEYEKNIGKMDMANFSRLQNELLLEWDALEKQVATLPAVAENLQRAAACPACGAAILTASAKFCHACGAALGVEK